MQWLYGQHPLSAALANPERVFRRLAFTKQAAEKLTPLLQKRHPKPEIVEAQRLEKLLPAGAVHQGCAGEAEPLPELSLEEYLAMGEEKPLLLLDQVTDPHNVGAILRSAAAFDAGAVITPARHAPEATGTLAKAASGALEMLPLIAVSNLAQAMEVLKKAGYWVAGLDGAAKQTLAQAKLSRKSALVLGAEGAGLRRLSAERCDLLVKLPIHAQMESLNVSNAAAVALYELSREVL